MPARWAASEPIHQAADFQSQAAEERPASCDRRRFRKVQEEVFTVQ